jgi:adenylosuccinate lyase
MALWHERDISHSSAERVIMPDSTLILDYMLNKFIEVIGGLVVYPDNMLANLAKTHGLIFSQRVLLELMERGLARMKAYDLVQRCAMKSWREGSDFKTNLFKDKDVRRYLDKKDLDKIFEPLFTTKAKGTGLGLSISRQIVQRLGGTIELANRPEGGARCTILESACTRHNHRNNTWLNGRACCPCSPRQHCLPDP